MRIGIDAHIILKEHKRYDPKIARYTEQVITHLIEADTKQEHTWVLFFDERMKGAKKLSKFKQENVIIKHFPFYQYRRYLPVLYSHMLISSFIAAARLNVFHSPEGLIPLAYPGKTVTTFHYVPKGKSESNLFVRTFMLGARTAFAQLCKRAKRIIVNNRSDKNLLMEAHGCGNDQVVVMEQDDIERVDWSKRVRDLMKVYGSLVEVKEKKVKAKTKLKKAKSKTKASTKSKKPKNKKKVKKKKKASQKKKSKK